MSLIRKYNRIALAIFITLGVFVFGYALYLISQSFWHRADYDRDVLLPDEQASELTKKGLRKQIVSLGGIEWLDTANSYYFIPVTQTSLKSPEL
ncbi:MAG: hypothetical protein WBA23_02370, partial [Tunicatimonas sp.]|uniref:hypothetical protein n=1 Tax=Tunicatimonas sp. TaxID=1940096 RepID=UPI003C74FA4E